jgi:hypothetical protein
MNQASEARGVRNGTRSLSFMSTVQVNSGTGVWGGAAALWKATTPHRAMSSPAGARRTSARLQKTIDQSNASAMQFAA